MRLNVELLCLWFPSPSLDECEAIPNICEGGTCKNTPGSFRCEVIN